MIIRRYSELITIPTFEERYRYLRLQGVVGRETFGFDRYLNQILYKSDKWKEVRDQVIIRDNGCDLGVEGFEIPKFVIVHHMNPVTLEQLENEDPSIFDPEFLICVSHNTHNAIHFGDAELLPKGPVERKRNDTCPWRHD